MPVVRANRLLASAVLVACACSGMVVAGCGAQKPTSITFHVRTDLSCDDLKTVSIAVGSLDELDTRPAQRITSSCTAVDIEMSTIGTLVVVPSGALDAEIGARVIGGVTRLADRCTADTGFKGCIVARRTLRFVPEQELEVVVDLRFECRDVACDTGTTCVRRSCLSAVVDPTACFETSCGDEQLQPPVTLGPDGGPVVVGPDGGPGPDGAPPPPTCAADEKICGNACVKTNTPETGCTVAGCSPCAGSDTTVFGCVNQQCVRSACKAGFKLCGGSCVPQDPVHGCSQASCTPCEATNGVASCVAGACSLQCANGYKLCGGRCVKVDDPTYGCGATGCTSAACPDPGSGNLVCNGATCAVGPCPAGTKACSQKCVPTDPNNGCQDPARCNACPQGDLCGGSPSVCQCQAEAASVTCASKACGPATNNCGQTINCLDTCPALGAGYACSGNSCVCTPDNAAACAGKQCGPAVNNCGQTITCPDTCKSVGFNWTCNGPGAGPNTCGCTPYTKLVACDGMACGSAPDECGAYYNCGNCTNGRQCRCGGVCMFSGQQCP